MIHAIFQCLKDGKNLSMRMFQVQDEALYKNLGKITRIICRELKSSCWAESAWLRFKKEEEKESKVQVEVR